MLKYCVVKVIFNLDIFLSRNIFDTETISTRLVAPLAGYPHLATGWPTWVKSKARDPFDE
jgi:hypothetical protein